MNDQNTSGLTKWGVLLGAIIVQLILGTVYGYSIFWQPLQSEIFPQIITQIAFDNLPADAQIVEQFQIVANDAAAKVAKSTNQSYLKWAFSICILSFALTMVVAGRVQDIKGPRFPAIVGAILMGSGFILASMMKNPFVFYLCHAAFVGVVALLLFMLYHAIFGKMDQEQMPILKHVPLAITASCVVAGVILGGEYTDILGEMDQVFMLWATVGFISGAGIGFAYVCPIAALVKWFPNHKGLVSGLAVAGFGFGAYLFKGESLGATGYISQHGITDFFQVHGIICLVGVIFGAFLLKNPPGTVTASITKNGDSTWQDTLKRPSFYIIWLMFFSGAMAGLMVIGILKPFVEEQLLEAGIDSVEAATAATAAIGSLAVMNAIGRVVWGVASDKIGRTGTFVIKFSIQALAMFIVGTLQTPQALIFAAGLIGFNFGGNFALFPSATADIFGAKNLGANYGWVFTSYGIAGVVGIAAGNAAKTATGSYNAAFTLAAGLCVMSALLAIGLAITTKKRAQAQNA